MDAATSDRKPPAKAGALRAPALAVTDENAAAANHQQPHHPSMPSSTINAPAKLKASPPPSPEPETGFPFDARLLSDAWGYDAPPGVYAMLLGGPGGPSGPTSMPELQPVVLPFQPLFAQCGSPPALLSPLAAVGFPPPLGAAGVMELVGQMDAALLGSPTAMTQGLLPPNAACLPPNAIVGGGGTDQPPSSVKDMTLNELRPHFNKPMAVVAKELGVCITLMKKICRRNGLVRWPHRRIRSLVNRITSLQVIAGSAAGPDQKRFQAQILALREELSAVIQNPNEKSRKAQADARARCPAASPQAAERLTERLTDRLVETGASDLDLCLKTEPESFGGVDMVDKAGEDRPTTRAAAKKRKRVARFGHVQPPPPIKIPRRDEPPASKLRCHSAPERRTRSGDRLASACARPATTSSRGKRGSISSILCHAGDQVN